MGGTLLGSMTTVLTATAVLLSLFSFTRYSLQSCQKGLYLALEFLADSRDGQIYGLFSLYCTSGYGPAITTKWAVHSRDTCPARNSQPSHLLSRFWLLLAKSAEIWGKSLSESCMLEPHFRLPHPCTWWCTSRSHAARSCCWTGSGVTATALPGRRSCLGRWLQAF